MKREEGGEELEIQAGSGPLEGLVSHAEKFILHSKGNGETLTDFKQVRDTLDFLFWKDH